MYINDIPVISQLTEQLAKWMDKNNHTNINDFKGALSLENTANPAEYERVQYMKHFCVHK
jgi:dihydroorotate dehydrogenase (fumarate)